MRQQNALPSNTTAHLLCGLSVPRLFCSCLDLLARKIFSSKKILVFCVGGGVLHLPSKLQINESSTNNKPPLNCRRLTRLSIYGPGEWGWGGWGGVGGDVLEKVTRCNITSIRLLMSSLGDLATVHQQRGPKVGTRGGLGMKTSRGSRRGQAHTRFSSIFPQKKKNETNGYGNVSFLILNSWSLCEDGQPAQMYIPSPYLALVSAATVVASCSD